MADLVDRPAKRLYSRAGAAAYLEKSTSEIDKMIRRGELLAKRDGRRIVIDVRELDRYVDRLPSLEPKRAAS
ncbi:helix-turn-helix domain-containing protein [Mycobacterium sp. CVI_P3]|uniref:Helix-turn-helix domain-containing protein n=1 Tax=Mycobacterium pinniadriaticum TaxID=2994102 RepID=A0ABT3SE29_9MYCO|nr:helix-turn-helix domain-containing protein [Mycobacterium pinniadriaticum]MCX2931349.1 helix-turn-helix domain-containing protein [Mycobacterium pinniadriaticum]MCX2937773.1 helix-turn-helix domain-containing protein [Mycobacterium pinniadriaticum]